MEVLLLKDWPSSHRLFWPALLFPIGDGRPHDHARSCQWRLQSKLTIHFIDSILAGQITEPGRGFYAPLRNSS